MCWELRQLGEELRTELSHAQQLWLPYCTNPGPFHQALFKHYRLRYLKMLRRINTWTGRDLIAVCAVGTFWKWSFYVNAVKTISLWDTRLNKVPHYQNNISVFSCVLELPGVHPLLAGHGAARLVCQRTRHAVGERMEQVEANRRRMGWSDLCDVKESLFKLKMSCEVNRAGMNWETVFLHRYSCVSSPVENTQQEHQQPESPQPIRIRRAEQQVGALQQNVERDSCGKQTERYDAVTDRRTSNPDHAK